MSARKPCIRCQREIDEWSKICPFCNWDQTNTAIPSPEEEAAIAQHIDYVPPTERSWKKYALIAVGVVAMLIGSFAVGALINTDDAVEEAPEPVMAEEKRGAPTPVKGRIDLVAVSDQGMPEAPITSAPVADPAQGLPTNEYDRHDATAVSSVEYQQLAARAAAEQKQKKAVVDPRTLGGPAYAQGQQVPPAAPARRRVVPPPAQASADNNNGGQSARWPNGEPRLQVRTRPVAQFQPVPNLGTRGTARLELTIGEDGTVRDINVRQSVAGMPQLIRDVQRWRFKPATENGRPVASSYSVDIAFNGND